MDCGEKGVYSIKVEPTKPTLQKFRFIVQMMVEPTSRYYPLYIMFLRTAWACGRKCGYWGVFWPREIIPCAALISCLVPLGLRGMEGGREGRDVKTEERKTKYEKDVLCKNSGK
jgi:hypothetical protein